MHEKNSANTEYHTVWDNCGTSEWGVANASSIFLKSKIRYLGDKKWEYYSETQNCWFEDKGKKQLTKLIRIDIIQIILERAQSIHENIHNYDDQFICLRLLNIAEKLRTPGFIKKVIIELQDFLIMEYL